MNERIKALAAQAGWCASADPYARQAFDVNLFAELIVHECASICYTSALEDSDAHAQNLLFEFNIDNCRNHK